MPRILRHLALACLVYMTLVLEVAAAPRIWVALAEEGGPYAEAATVLKGELDAEFDLNINHWRAVLAARDDTPDLIVAVGVAALDGVLERIGKRGDAWARVPLLAVLVPEAVFEARQAGGQAGRRPFSAALLDQPLGRQLALIKRALPQYQRVGVLSGPQTRLVFGVLDKEAQARGLILRKTRPASGAEEIYPALKQAIDEAEVILALPDPLIYNSASLQNILLTTYRARIPLVAFSPAYVKAGAVLAVYSTPAQVARRAAEMVRQWQSGRTLPVPQKPREFEVVVNERVAASLGLWIDAPNLIVEELRRQEEKR
ncbi:MAG: ABC transporter substrate binding protein [Pseudomonadota bacterium]